MPDYTLTRRERETIIRWDAEEQVAYIDTANPVDIRKLDRLVEEFPDTYRCVKVDEKYGAKKYKVPASFIRYGKPASEARKAADIERGKALRRNLGRDLPLANEESPSDDAGAIDSEGAEW